jgi:putative aldouronate transport system permease protein
MNAYDSVLANEQGRNERLPESKLWKRLKREKFLYLLILPGLILLITFSYLPMFGTAIAFKDYSPFKGILGSPWVGFKHFRTLFEDREVIKVIWRTLYISFLQIVIIFPLPIILSLMLNEVRISGYKRFIQTIVYLPHFISWVILISIVTIFFKINGLINKALEAMFGIDPIPFLTSTEWFIPMLLLELIWKETGWGTIIFLAALAGVNQELYEAATMDGAGRFRQIWHITLPAIRSVTVILLILQLGNVLSVGFEQIFLMLNPFTMSAGNVLDTYVYFKGIQGGEYSFATAVGLFKSVVGLVLIVMANKLAKRFGESGLF